ncbi:MAG: GntR family transcriptional regulator [Acidobacteriaceae bacterium]
METFLQIRVVLDGPTPVYRQVVDQIRVLCLDGRLEPGQKLPSVRQLAGSLGVHFNTIADAYRTLADEGWLEVRQGRSAIVRKRSEPKQPSRVSVAQHGSRLRNLVAELRSHGFSKEWIMSEVKTTLEGGLQ